MPKKITPQKPPSTLSDESMQEIFFQACRTGDTETVKTCINQATLETHTNGTLRVAVQGDHLGVVSLLLPYASDYALKTALWEVSFKGQVEMAKLLLPYIDARLNDSAALNWAADGGHIELVKLLLPNSDPMADESQALRSAALNGHIDVVRLLLPLSDPKGKCSYALRMASYKGYFDIVKLLIPVSDPKEKDSEALYYAATAGNRELVALLWDVSDPKVALEQIMQAIKDGSNLHKSASIIQERLKVEESQKELSSALSQCHQEKPKRKSSQM